MGADPITEINTILAELVGVENHQDAKTQLLEVIAKAANYQYAFIVELNENGQEMTVTAAHVPEQMMERLAALTGYRLLGFTFSIDIQETLKQPDVEVFSGVHEFFPRISRPIGQAVGRAMGLKKIVSIRQRTLREYIGAVNFISVDDDADQELLEYLCSNHLAYALRLMREQERFVRASKEHTEKLESRVMERTEELQRMLEKSRSTEEQLTELFLHLTDTQQNLEERVKELSNMMDGLRRITEANSIEEVYASILESLLISFNSEHAAILTCREDGTYRSIASTDPALDHCVWKPQSFFARVRSGKIIPAFNLSLIPEWQDQDGKILERLVSGLHMPLQSPETEAILVCFHSEIGYFTQEDVLSGERFMAFATQAFRSAELFDKIQQERNILEWTVAERTEDLLKVNAQLKQEIAERKAAEAIAKQNERLYRSLFDRNNDGVMFIGLDGKHTAVNQQAADMLGYSIEELVGIGMSDIVVPEQLQEGQSVLKRVMDGELVPVYQRKYRRKDGSTFPVEISLSLVYDDKTGEKLYVQSMIRDITSRVEAQKNVINLAKFPSENPYPILRITLDGRLAYANESAAELIAAWYLQVGDMLDNYLQQEFCSTEGLVNGRINKEWDVGLNRYLFTIVRFEEQGYVNVYAKDVTEERRLDRMKSEFIASVSHELRTPLAAILGFTELLLDPETGELNPIQNEFMQTLDESGRYLLRLVNDLLDVTKMDVGRLSLAMENMEISDLFARAQSRVISMISEKNVRIQQEVAEDLPTVVADPARMEQVMVNLLSNSIKFSEKGSKVFLSADLSEDGLVRIRVKDRGMGIPPEDLKKLFEKFHRGQNVLGKNISGTGLGLYISRSIIEAHGGRITVRSVVKQGTEFEILIPVDASFNYRSIKL